MSLVDMPELDASGFLTVGAAVMVAAPAAGGALIEGATGAEYAGNVGFNGPMGAEFDDDEVTVGLKSGPTGAELDDTVGCKQIFKRSSIKKQR